MIEKESQSGNSITLYSPKEIKAHLDEYIIGQDEAKKILSVAVYNHYKRILLNDNAENESVTVEKSNILMAGPTGCGKSAMIKCIADFLGVPCYIADATSLTQAGYVGDDVESILSGLLRNCNYCVPVAECGIIAIDEVDKLAKRGASEHISRDVVGEGVQQALLKMVEGDLVGVPPQEGRKHPDQQLIYINTKNILFIGTGAFSGMDEIINRRLNINRIGFDTGVSKRTSSKKKDYNPYDYMCQEDLRSYGLIPEFIGRFPIVTNINGLSKDELKRILLEPKNAIIKQFQRMMELDNINFSFTDKALDLIADIAIKLGTGARGLRSIMENIWTEYVYEYCDDKREEKIDVVVTDKDVKKHLNERFAKYIEK